MKELEPKENDKYREAFNAVVNKAEEVAPILETGVVELFQNPRHRGTGLIVVSFGIPDVAARFSLIIGAIDTKGNPYTLFNRLEVTEELSKQKTKLEEKSEKPFTGYLRFLSKKADKVAQQIPGRRSVYKSPFEDNDRPIYRITSGQFSFIEHLLKGEGVDYEIVEWPKDAEKPYLPPPGFW